jgi:adenine-specific DNA methylase
VDRQALSTGTLFPSHTSRFPSTRYQGSKAKLANWIWRQIADLEFTTCLDLFGGTGSVAYRLKQEGKSVTYNDLLRFNHWFAKALVENSSVRLSSGDVKWLLGRHDDITYPSFVRDTFHDIYFTDDENQWIDQTVTNIRQLADPYKHALAFFALCQACIVKRPYNLFHRKNLYVRFAQVERSFGNKASWDRPFPDWFRLFMEEANQAVFDNGQPNQALCFEALQVPGEYDLVYIDPPYLPLQGAGVDYYDFYHFLEGLAMYDDWPSLIDHKSKHRRLKPRPSDWTDRDRITAAFARVFERFRDSMIVVSYRSDGIPAQTELAALLKRYKQTVRLAHYGRYKYVLSTNNHSSEVLLIGT